MVNAPVALSFVLHVPSECVDQIPEHTKDLIEEFDLGWPEVLTGCTSFHFVEDHFDILFEILASLNRCSITFTVLSRRHKED